MTTRTARPTWIDLLGLLLILAGGVAWAFLGRMVFIDLAPWTVTGVSEPTGTVIFAVLGKAKADFSGVTFLIDELRPGPQMGEAEVADRDSGEILWRTRLELKPGGIYLARFPRVKTSEGRSFRCSVTIAANTAVRMRAFARYSLTLKEAFPFVLRTLVKGRPPPFSKGGVHLTLLALYLGGTAALWLFLRQIDGHLDPSSVAGGRPRRQEENPSAAPNLDPFRTEEP